jgi:hypothetical protein
MKLIFALAVFALHSQASFAAISVCDEEGMVGWGKCCPGLEPVRLSNDMYVCTAVPKRKKSCQEKDQYGWGTNCCEGLVPERVGHDTYICVEDNDRDRH